jgi:hypothetical protein
MLQARRATLITLLRRVVSLHDSLNVDRSEHGHLSDYVWVYIVTQERNRKDRTKGARQLHRARMGGYGECCSCYNVKMSLWYVGVVKPMAEDALKDPLVVYRALATYVSKARNIILGH